MYYMKREQAMQGHITEQAVRSQGPVVTGQDAQDVRNSRQAYFNLFLATAAFAVAFTAWSLISPIAKQLQQVLQLDDLQKSALIAMPVILGSLLRIPLGLLTDRFGGRKVFTALLLLTLLPMAF